MLRKMSNGQERRARIRDQMRDFYNFESGGMSPQRAGVRGPSESNRSAASGPPDMDLDSDTFNVQKYTTALLQRESLKGLVETDTELLRRIRSLDGELQDLVYKNYSKFISATDTIRQMKDNVSDMDAKLQALSSNVSHIDQVSRVISDNLQSHRAKLEEMFAASKALKKVEFLGKLAERMQHFIQTKKYHVAVKLWVAGETVFNKHKDLMSINSTRQECQRMARKLYEEIEKAVLSAPLSDVDAEPTVKKLIEDMRLVRNTSAFPEKNVSQTTEDDFYQEVLNSLLASAETTFKEAVGKAQLLFSHALNAETINPNASILEKEKNMQQGSQIRESMQQLKAACTNFNIACERAFELVNQDSDIPQKTSQKLSIHVVSRIQPVLLSSLDWTTQAVGKFFCHVIEDLTLSRDLLKSPQQTREVVLGVLGLLSKHIKLIAQTLKTLAGNFLDSAHSNQSQSFFILIDEAVKSIFVQLIAQNEAGVTKGRSVAAASSTNVVISADQLCDLLSAHICKGIAKNTIADVAGSVSLDTAALRNSLNETAKRRAQRYIVSRGQCIIQDFLSNLAAACGKEPTAPSRLIVSFAQTIKDFHSLHKEWFPIESSKHLRVGSGGSAISHGSGSEMTIGTRSSRTTTTSHSLSFLRREHTSLSSDVDRAISKGSATVSNVPSQLECNLLTEYLTNYVLKGLIEKVRDTPSFAGVVFQQLQIDFSFLIGVFSNGVVAGWFKKDVTPIALVNELATCVFERTTDKASLPPRVAEKLASVPFEL